MKSNVLRRGTGSYTVLPGLIDCHAHLVGAESTANVAEPCSILLPTMSS